MDSKHVDPLLRAVRALANPKRLAIFSTLIEEATVTEVADRFAMSPSSASVHLDTLRRAHLLEAAWKGRTHVYRWPAKRKVALIIFRPGMEIGPLIDTLGAFFMSEETSTRHPLEPPQPRT